MHRYMLAIGATLMLGVSANIGTSAAAQSSKIPARDCLGSMHGDTCEMTRDQYDIYTRNRDWNENVRRNEEYAAQHRQLSAEAKARFNQRTLNGASAVMQRRRAAAEANGD